MKQPTAPVYPEFSTEEGQNYRLQKISEIEKLLYKERETHERHCIKSINVGLILQKVWIQHLFLQVF